MWCSEFAREGVDLSLLVGCDSAEDNGRHEKKILYFNASLSQKCESSVYPVCVCGRARVQVLYKASQGTWDNNAESVE